jgi:hypothetical protein
MRWSIVEPCGEVVEEALAHHRVREAPRRPRELAIAGQRREPAARPLCIEQAPDGL